MVLYRSKMTFVLYYNRTLNIISQSLRRVIKGVFNLVLLLMIDLQHIPNFAKKRSAQTVQAFNQAKRQPFHLWLKALGAPAALSAKTHDDWQSLVQLSAQDWQQQRHFSPTQAKELSAFFQHPAVQAAAVDLQKHNVAGF